MVPYPHTPKEKKNTHRKVWLVHRGKKQLLETVSDVIQILDSLKTST